MPSPRAHGPVRRYVPILALIACNILIGLLIFRDYGLTIDEPANMQYGRHVADYFRSGLGSEYHRFGTGHLDEKGPAYFTVARIFAELGQRLMPAVGEIAFWHLAGFLLFQVAVFSLYDLALRWMDPWGAFAASALFATQPLFWGHAFINPKDSPFMVLFLASVTFGLRMADGVIGRRIDGSPGSTLTGTGMAQHPGNTMKEVLSGRWPGLLRSFGRNVAASFTNPGVWLAGVLLGLTVSIRVLGPYAGALVGLWMVIKGRWKALPALVAYTTIAISVAYLSWPFLWADPVGRFLDSLALMSDYPYYAKVLFNGQLYTPQTLPGLYIPTLMAIQLTEPVWALFAVSIPIIAYRLAKESWGIDLVLLVITWLLLPILAFIATHRPLYDNIRQLHFLLPPVFLVSGVGVSWILGRLKRTWMRLGLVALLLVPGILQLVQLHPYEYVYYNQFVGGLQGASRRFEPDYWMASTAEAGAILNDVAAADSTVFTVEPALLSPYLREDLHIKQIDLDDSRAQRPGYVLIPARRNLDLRFLESSPSLYVIGRQGMDFMVIKQVFPEP